ncbi:MAG: four helix bundle protein [Anaerolineales bacterium]
MNYSDWLDGIPETFKRDPLWRMKVYRMALFLGDLSWRDVSKLNQDRRTWGLADQLYRSVGSIAANVAEGYSRSSVKDRIRFYEYALGSAREARGWYHQGRSILSPPVSEHRIELLTEIIRILLTIIKAERSGSRIKEQEETYTTTSTILERTPPLPN